MSDKPRTIYTTVWTTGNNIGSTFESSPADDANAPRTPVLYPDLTVAERKEIVTALYSMASFYAQFLPREEAADDLSPR